MTLENFLEKDIKTADLELSEQLEHKCHLGKAISTLNLKWYVFAAVCCQQN